MYMFWEAISIILQTPLFLFMSIAIGFIIMSEAFDNTAEKIGNWFRYQFTIKTDFFADPFEYVALGFYMLFALIKGLALIWIIVGFMTVFFNFADWIKTVGSF